MARLPATHASKQDYERAVGQAADLGLFLPGGSFERFPGAVLLVGQNNMVLGANPAAEPDDKETSPRTSIRFRDTDRATEPYPSDEPHPPARTPAAVRSA